MGTFSGLTDITGGLSSKLAKFLEGSEPLSLLGDIPLRVITDKDMESNVTVPTRRVEDGFNISDSVRKDPRIFHLTVVDNEKEYMRNREALQQLQESGIAVDFYFAERDFYKDVILESMTEVESNNQKNGFTYYLVLRQIQVAKLDESDVTLDSKAAKTTGGKKKRTTAKSSKATDKEVKAVNKARGRSGLKELGL